MGRVARGSGLSTKDQIEAIVVRITNVGSGGGWVSVGGGGAAVAKSENFGTNTGALTAWAVIVVRASCGDGEGGLWTLSEEVEFRIEKWIRWG